MRILFVTNLYPRPDQPARGMFNAQTVRELSRDQPVAVRVLVPEWRFWRWPALRGWTPPQGEKDVAYWPVFYLPGVGRSLGHLAYRWSVRRELAAALRDSEGVLVPWLYPDGCAVASVAAELGRRPWLMALGSDTFHLRSPWRRRVILKASRSAGGIICVCRTVADRLTAAGVDPGNVHVVPNGVNAEQFHFRSAPDALAELHGRSPELAARAAAAREGGGRIVLAVGNLVPVKGLDLAIKAFAALRANAVGPGAVSLFIIGSGPQRRMLARLARRLGVSGSVHFLGSRPHPEVALWMNVADVLCLPSRSEGMPNVVIEAVVSGLPVAAARVGDCPEMLAGEPAARLCECDSMAGMASGLRELLDAPVGREALAGRHAKRYSWRSQAEAILRLMTGQRAVEANTNP